MAAKVVTFTSQKGGTGKSTGLLTMSAFLAERGNRVMIVDTDEQLTAYRSVTCGETPFPATVISLAGVGDKICDELLRHKSNFDFILIDTAPSVTSSAVHAALLLSDAAIVPVEPSPPDIWSALATTTLIAGVQRVNPKLQARILANRVLRTALSRMVLGAMNDLGIPMLQNRLHSRVAFQAAALAGGSFARLGSAAKPAKDEVSAVTDEFLAVLGGGQ